MPGNYVHRYTRRRRLIWLILLLLLFGLTDGIIWLDRTFGSAAVSHVQDQPASGQSMDSQWYWQTSQWFTLPGTSQ